jgi:hypothetical protein
MLRDLLDGWGPGPKFPGAFISAAMNAPRPRAVFRFTLTKVS